MTEREKILSSTRELFFREGFYKTTVGEVATKLRISKKTIYKHFTSKEELLSEAVLGFFYAQKSLVEKIVSSDKNSIEKFYLLFERVGEITLEISEKFLRDVQLHTPELWKKVDDFRTDMMLKKLTLIAGQGVREGFIKEIPIPIVVTALVSSIRGISRNEFLIHNHFTLSTAAKHTLDIIFNGIVTKKGMTIYNKIKSKDKL